jgi:hypothetical protein
MGYIKDWYFSDWIADKQQLGNYRATVLQQTRLKPSTLHNLRSLSRSSRRHRSPFDGLADNVTTPTWWRLYRAVHRSNTAFSFNKE